MKEHNFDGRRSTGSYQQAHFGLFLKKAKRNLKALGAKLQTIIDDVVKDRDYRICLAAVSTGDGALEWSGAAGLADEENNIPITTDTPFFLASVTKLFTSTLIMQLYEADKLDLLDSSLKT